MTEMRPCSRYLALSNYVALCRRRPAHHTVRSSLVSCRIMCGPLVAPFCSTTKKDVTSNGTKAESAASRDNSAVKKDRATPQQISLQGNPEKGGNFNLTDEEKGSNPQFPPIDSTKMIHTDKPRKLPPLPASHLPPLDEANTTPRKKKKKKAKRKSQEDEE